MRIFLTLSSLLLLIACNKEQSSVNTTGILYLQTNKLMAANQSNVTFENIDNEVFITGAQEYRGVKLNDDILTLPFRNYEFEKEVTGAFEYNFSNGSIRVNKFHSADTSNVKDILSIGKNEYLIVGFDQTSNTDRMARMDNQFNLVSQEKFKDFFSDRDFHYLNLLDNGNFVILYNNYKTLECRSLDFKRLWSRVIPINSKITFLVTTPNSIILSSSNQIVQYNYLGEELKTITLNKNYTIKNLARSGQGIIVIGQNERADLYNDFFIQLYDRDLNLTKSNQFGTNKFSDDPNSISIIKSNILSEPEGYFFVMNLRKYKRDALSAEKAILIKLNREMEPEFYKLIDSYRSGVSSSSYLVRYKNELLCIGPTFWNRQKGYSFIKMDMDGIIQE